MGFSAYSSALRSQVTHLVLAFRGYYHPDSENEDRQKGKVGRAEGEEYHLLVLDRNDDVARAELSIEEDEGSQSKSNRL